MRGASVARRWGWHRLDRGWASRLVAGAAVRPGDLVLDVGAGDGVITEALLELGARVVAIELHPGRARLLRVRFEGSDVRVVVADAADLRLPRQAFSVVANPPFGASMALVGRLVAPGSRLVSAHVVVPRYVASRWCAATAPGRGRWSQSFEVSIGGRIPAHAFHPSAGRDAAVLRIRRTAGRPTGGAGARREPGSERKATRVHPSAPTH